jgi:hypothetical protein
MVNEKEKIFVIIISYLFFLGSKNRTYNNQRQQQQLSTNNLPFYRKYFIRKKNLIESMYFVAIYQPVQYIPTLPQPINYIPSLIYN